MKQLKVFGPKIKAIKSLRDDYKMKSADYNSVHFKALRSNEILIDRVTECVLYQ